MSNPTTEPITLEAYNPGDLLMDANARTNAEATVTKADVALCKTIAASRPYGCGNNVPIIIVRRPDGRLRVRAGHRRTIGCLRAGVPVLGFVVGAEGDEQADRRARDNYRFRYGVPLAARYLAWLAEHTDYSLSDIEAEVAAHTTARVDDDGAGDTQVSTKTS
jgi:hypothetical protein